MFNKHDKIISMVLKFDEDKQNQRLAELRQKESEDVAQLLASRYGVNYVDLRDASISTTALRLIREDDARQANVAAFNVLNKKVALAVLSPRQENTQIIIRELEKRGYVPEIHIVSERSLEYAWQRYQDISFATESSAGTLDIASTSVEDFIAQTKTLEDARKLIDEVQTMKKSFRISRIVEIVIAAGIATKASDIHVEPSDEEVALRFRIDGVLTEISKFDFDTYKLLNSRIKLLSGMKINIKDEAQNGRFTVKIGDTEYEIRSSMLPGNTGESIVMRILDPNSLTIPLKDLGIPDKLLNRLVKEVDRPNGMLLNTGPTGSGKTTALYAFLNRKRSPGIKIITIEDPIEYHLPGIVQTQVDSNQNYDFNSGLKNSLRQDPDVIMIGEIRDNETAETAVQAALTGHLVFSTLHTNDAAGAFPRLIDLGVDSKIISSALNVVIAQRLVRRVCPHCKKEAQLEGKDREIFDRIYGEIRDPDVPKFDGKVYEAVGCPECSNTGYKGRVGIFEAIFMDKKVEEAIQSYASAIDIKKAAQPQEIMDMAQDGLVKIVQGITTFEEVSRVVDLEYRESTKDASLSDQPKHEKNYFD
jgi:type II secretory ATPase GspE/PulE/Tfp pilus assembly ATPase PilB-like protein